MSGSRMISEEDYQKVFLFASKNSSIPWHDSLAYGCHRWVQDVQGLCGTAYTIKRWQSLCRRGLKLSIRTDTYLKRSSSP